ncbi:RAC serine/threonine-protein kinase-like [Dendrobates tinctorius]|uniref:RAC serine/threonine-protein kinase-like n=1 Tax=Dendrobates tinctorius TaxID=92724 RepID=UPI003CCA1745
MTSNTADMPAQEDGDARCSTLPFNPKNPIDLSTFSFCKELCEGGFGEVVLASHPVTEELVAVKIMAKKQRKKEKVYKELEIMKIATGCRYLMSLRAFAETPDDYLIGMDYMVRGDLFNHMTHWMPFNIQTTSDLKPENILIDDNGHIKISDFGLSAINVFQGVILKNFVGSKGYMAPEVMDGQGYNHLADSFSLGVILYIMAVGHQPFYSRGSLEEYRQSLEEDVPHYALGICFDAVDLIDGLLCKNPFFRYAITSYFRTHPFFSSISWSESIRLITISPMQVPSMKEALRYDMKII